MRRWLPRTIALLGLAAVAAACTGAAAAPTSPPTLAPSASPTDSAVLLPTAAPSPTPTPTPKPSPTPTPSATPTPVPTPTPTPTPPPSAAYTFLAGYQGTFNGTWSDKTMTTSGKMTWVLSADPATQTIKVDLTITGTFFGGPGPKSETLVLSGLTDGKITGTSALVGGFTGTIGTGGKVTVTIGGLAPKLVRTIAATATFAGGKTISISYAITTTIGLVASGSVKLTRS